MTTTTTGATDPMPTTTDHETRRHNLADALDTYRPSNAEDLLAEVAAEDWLLLLIDPADGEVIGQIGDGAWLSRPQGQPYDEVGGYRPLAVVNLSTGNRYGVAVSYHAQGVAPPPPVRVGDIVRDDLGRVWRVREWGEKDGWPTIAGDSYWARLDDVEPATPEEVAAYTEAHSS